MSSPACSRDFCVAAARGRGEGGLGRVVALGALVEHVLAVDVLAGMLEVLLRAGDPVAGDGSDSGIACAHVTPAGRVWRRGGRWCARRPRDSGPAPTG